MESWSYISGGKGLASNEKIPSSDTLIRSSGATMGWDLASKRSLGSSILVPGPATENRGFGEQVADDSTRYALNSKVDGGKIINTGTVSPNAFHLEDESTSRVSSTEVDSNCKSPSFIDLKLGRFGDPKDGQNSRVSKGTPIASSSDSSTLPKKARVGVTLHAACCQVYGCSKDLSASKEYHKRHKVCEAHSKTAKVIVKGIEQRFCQQCSRFHLLAEFDDGKRSCRRRLAGHNERRRKTQVTVHSGQSGRLLQSYNGFDGSGYHGTAFSTASFICQDILPSGLLDPEKRIKLEDGAGLSPLSAFPIAIGNLHTKSNFPSGNLEKLYPKLLDGGANTATGSILRERLDTCPPDWSGQTSSPRSLLLSTSFINEDFTAFDAVSTIQGLSGFPDSGCALSLLSSQSQNSSSQSSGILISHQLPVPGGSVHYSVGQVSEKLAGVSSRDSTTGVSKKFASTIMSSAEGSQLGPILISDGSSSVNFDLTHGIFRGSDFVDAKDHLSCEDDTTIDLLQLSSQLQRVEHQKQSVQMQQENNAFCCSRIT